MRVKYFYPGINRMEHSKTYRPKPAAADAKIKVTFKENNKEKSVYRDVNSGGSFGSSPLRQHIGVGQALSVSKIEIKWPVTNKVQIFENLPVDINIKIRESDSSFTAYKLAMIDFTSARSGLLSCSPKK